jgi:hypothetical protein
MMNRLRSRHYILLALLFVPGIILSVMYHDSPALFVVGTIELALIAIVVNAFVFIYLRRNWRSNPYGRGLMYSKMSLAILADLSLITIALGPDWAGRSTARVILYGLILVAQAHLLQLLVQAEGTPGTVAQYKEGEERKVDADVDTYSDRT